MTEVKIGEPKSLMEILVKGKIVFSNSDYRRLAGEGAITNLENNEKILDTTYMPKAGDRFRVGKKGL